MKSHSPSIERNAPMSAAEPREARVGATPETMERKRVLIVDRDRDARAGLANLLESMGYDALVAGTAEEALGVAARFEPDAAFVDIGAPQLDGGRLARALRETVAKRSLLLIALTGWGQPQYREMALAAGYDVHWVKPISSDQLSFLLSMTLV